MKRKGVAGASRTGDEEEPLYPPGFTLPQVQVQVPRDKYDRLEERLKAVEGNDTYGVIDANELSLVPDLVIPPKFKTSNFEKYDGTKCPSAHITMFCRKMMGHTHNDKLLIHCFHDSLTAPDRLSLQNMEKKLTKTFKEYAHRWKDAAAQVQPPLTEKEITVLFVNTLKAPYYDRLVGNTTKNFSDMVISGEMIENIIKSGKIEGSKKKTATLRKKEQETHVVTHTNPSHHPFVSYNPYPHYYPTTNQISQQPYHYRGPQQPLPRSSFSLQPSNYTLAPSARPFTRPTYPNSNQRNSQNNNNRERPHFDPIPMTYTDLYPRLIEKHLVVPIIIKPLKPPFPKWYDPNAHCDYHYRNPGHSIEHCTALKRKVQGLINEGVLNFDTSQQETPNVNGNPLSNHTRPSINALPIEPQNCSKVINSTESCNYHRGVIGHSIKNCHQFHQEVQKLMDEGRMKFYQEKKELVKVEVSTIDSKNKFGRRPKKNVISQYLRVKQLNKMPTKISLLSLLLSLESHRNALQKVLNQAYMSHITSVEYIHMAGAVPSSLHQKVKFIVKGKLTCMAGEEDLLLKDLNCVRHTYLRLLNGSQTAYQDGMKT
ncbi:uncharacterized protein LOC111288912 [Durio zibethinus]|uniref:Uncharacterized protein LOC111288912 n=1 Tax=Durio zibethinus TaxID=66656 RepID=A0A6P5Y596_DURZI|nr:uncharacterized protein LOC111288912 [Durio zibethinus]